MKWITVSELCEQEGISHQCVYQKLKYARYGKLRDHIRESYGEPLLLDEEAVAYLRPKKPTGKLRNDALAGIEKRLTDVEESNAGKSAEIHDLAKRMEIIEQAMKSLILSTHNGKSSPPDDSARREV